MTFATASGRLGRTLAAVILMCGLSPRTDSALEITVRPSVATAPATVRVVARIEPHEENRTLVVQAESPQFYRASHVQLDGAHAARTHPMLLKNLPAGLYTITVTVEGTDGILAVDRGFVEVIE